MRAPVAAAVVLLACHSDPATRTGPMTIAVSTGGTPEAGVPVVFHRPDGSVQEVATTDAEGRAGAVVSEGGLVTVARQAIAATPTGGIPAYWLVTVAGVEPGDALALDGSTLDGGALAGTASVAFPGPVESASSYRVDAACTAAFADEGYVATLPMTIVAPGCGTSLDALALARAPGGGLLAYATALDVPVTGTAPEQAASVALGPWRTDFTMLAVEATDAPAGAAALYATLTPRRNGRAFGQSAMLDAVDVAPGASASLALPFPTALGPTAGLKVSVFFAPPGPGGFRYGGEAWMEKEVPVEAPYAIDLAETLPPQLSSAAVADVDGRLVASWQQARVDPALDVTYLSIGWDDGDGSATHAWDVVLPPNATSIAAPALPPELAAYGSRTGARSTRISVQSADLADARGYAEYRRRYLAATAAETAGDAWRAAWTFASTPAP